MFRIHEWMADHSTHVQYPNPRAARTDALFPRFKFTHKMSWLDRISMALLGVFAVLVGTIALIVLGILVFAFFFPH